MITNPDLEKLKKSDNYPYAAELLSQILEHKKPDMNLLKQLYGNAAAEAIYRTVNEYFERNFPVYNKVREHNYNAVDDIASTRIITEGNFIYQRIHHEIIFGRTPSVKDLEIFYGNYSEYVQKIIQKYIDAKIRRKCELGAATHLHRVGAIVHQLRMNDEGTYNYSAIAVMHDSIEDLLELKSDGDNTHPDAEAYNSFIEEFIPRDIADSIKILTNHYDLIITYIRKKLHDLDMALSLPNILNELESISSSNLNNLSNYAEEIHTLLKDFQGGENLIEDVKWACYKELYLEGIAEEISRSSDHRLYEIKGVDLSDNAHGKGALSAEGRIRNINKNFIWSEKGKNINSRWLPFLIHINEIMEDSLLAAEQIILSDLLQPYSAQDFVMSALLKIKKLERVFYES